MIEVVTAENRPGANQWITNQAVSGETNLTVVVESRSLFQASAIYDAALSKDVFRSSHWGRIWSKISPSLFSKNYTMFHVGHL